MLITHLEDHPRTVVISSPKDSVVGPLPNGLSITNWDDPPRRRCPFSVSSHFFFVGLGDQRQKGAPERLLA